MSATWFIDLLDDDPPIDVVADVRFLSSADGGKTCPARAQYRPNHNFGSPDDRAFYIGQIELLPGDEIALGESRRVSIHFLSGAGLKELLTPGREWRIQEGTKLVAFARVLEVSGEP